MKPSGRFPLLPRKKNSDKKNYGHALIVAGSSDYPGAAILCSRAAMIAGAGLTTLMAPECIREAVYRRFAPEVMTQFLPSTSNGSFSYAGIKKILSFIQERSIASLVVGPGITRHPETLRLVQALVRAVNLPIVLDADALRALRLSDGRKSIRTKNAVLTPNAGEFAGLFGYVLPKEAAKRRAKAKKEALSKGVVLVAKAHRTLVTDGGELFENRTGTPAMAKGGSGDVLSGMIGAFLAQGMPAYPAACWAVYFHGLAGQIAAKKTGELALTSSILIENLPNAFKQEQEHVLA